MSEAVADDPLPVLAMREDPGLIRLVAVWAHMPRDRWGRPIISDVARIAGLPKLQARSIVDRALTLGLVREDGSISEWARKWLIVQLTDRKKPRQKSAP